ncbi:Aldose sugar dehydrogenase YliI [Thalassocella blandensis]|nr:Aldose sugar dehydrogenase YliI [Thalassocella blandensis]
MSTVFKKILNIELFQPLLRFQHLTVLTAAILLSSCGGSGGGSPEPTLEPSPTPSPTTSPTPTTTVTPTPEPTRPPNTSCITPEAETTEGEFGFEKAFPNLPAMQEPMAMVQAPNDSSFWFIATRAGRVYSIENTANVSTRTLALDISDQVTTVFEMGFTGFAIHPDYPTDNRVFAVYNNVQNEESVLASFTVNTANRTIDSNSETVLLTLQQPQGNHNGGDISFGPDGHLYVAFGDGGGGAARQYSQQLTNLSGTMIRLDVSTQPYSIPADNPFNTGQARCNSSAAASGQNCPEIFAYGFRNPWRFSIDQHTGDIWLGDVGEVSFEEINRVTSGGNYGWPIMEGDSCFNSNSCSMDGLSRPIVSYGRSLGVSVVGGYVYRGTRYPALANQYIYGDVYSNIFSRIANDSAPGTNGTQLFQIGTIYGLAQGNDGEIYLLQAQPDGAGDNIFHLVGGNATTYTMPANLSETGCFDTTTKTSASGVVDYAVISPLWSDGADKQRAFAIPDTTTIDVLSDGDFEFPTDTMLIKHFLNGDTFLETRFLIQHASGWSGYSYEWNDAQTDATLLDEGRTKDVGDFIHTFPSAAQCNACHTDAANHSLGLELAQLNAHSEIYDTNMIDYLNEAGYFSAPQSSNNSPQLYALDDNQATLSQRARSYLHVNCSNCHREGGPASFMDLRFTTSLAQTNTCDVPPSVNDMGIGDARRIAPGNPDASILLLRMESLDPEFRMPNIASLTVDTDATQLIRNWITSMSNCN